MIIARLLAFLVAIPAAYLPGFSQEMSAIRVPITFRDLAGHRHTITFGMEAGATYGFDSMLGEQPIPPVPAVPAFDIRFLDPMGRKQYPYESSYLDIRGLNGAAQIDTFFVSFQPSEGRFPITVSWPLRLLDPFISVLMMIPGPNGNREVDMKETGTVSISAGNNLTIITQVEAGAVEGE
jgi:hypothetical protein